MFKSTHHCSPIVKIGILKILDEVPWWMDWRWPKLQAQVTVSSELSFNRPQKLNSEETVTWACSSGHPISKNVGRGENYLFSTSFASSPTSINAVWSQPFLRRFWKGFEAAGAKSRVGDWKRWKFWFGGVFFVKRETCGVVSYPHY